MGLFLFLPFGGILGFRGRISCQPALPMNCPCWSPSVKAPTGKGRPRVEQEEGLKGTQETMRSCHCSALWYLVNTNSNVWLDWSLLSYCNCTGEWWKQTCKTRHDIIITNKQELNNKIYLMANHSDPHPTQDTFHLEKYFTKSLDRVITGFTFIFVKWDSSCITPLSSRLLMKTVQQWQLLGSNGILCLFRWDLNK